MQVNTNEGPYFASLLPGENEDEEITFVYVLMFPVGIVTDIFLKKIGNPSYFSNGDKIYLSEKLAKIVGDLNRKNGFVQEENDVKMKKEILKLKQLSQKSGANIQLDLDKNSMFLKGYQFNYFSDETYLISEINHSLVISILSFSLMAIFLVVISVWIVRKISLSIEVESLKLVKSSESISKSSKDLAQSSKILANLNSEQAHSISNVASSVEEVTAMVKNNVDASERSQDISKSIYETTQGGCQLNSELLDSVDQLSKSNKEMKKIVDIVSKIGEKTEIIDEIVFQTKILSFNAAVEAERAGENGRGFSVVAQEVSSLARSSGKASTEIGAIVKESSRNAQTLTENNDRKCLSA